MADLNYSVAVNTTPGIASLQKLQDKVGTVTKTFGGLQAAVAGLFAASVIRNAMAYADAVSDISTATNIAVANVLGFSSAVEQNGGTAEGAEKAILKFGVAIGEAADGSSKAQSAFAKAGVSLKDLATLSEKDLLAKTIKGLAGITDASKRAAAQNDIFGKSMRGVDVVGLQQGYAGAVTESQKYAASVAAAGVVQDKLAGAIRSFQLSLLETLKPMADFLASLSKEQIDQTVKAVVDLGKALLIIGAVAKGLTWIAGLWASMKAASLLASLSMKSVGTTMSMVVWQAGKFGAAFSGAIGWVAKLGEVGTFVFTLFTKRLPFLVRGFVGLLGPIGKVVAALWVVADVIDIVFKTSIIDTFAAKVKAAWNWMKEIAGFSEEGPKGRSYSEADTAAMNQYVEGLKEEKRVVREVEDAFAKKRKEIGLVSKAFAEHNTQTIDSINFENTLIGKTEEYAQVLRAQEAVFIAAAAESKKLLDAKALLTKEESALGAEYDKQIAKIAEIAKVDAVRIGNAITNSQSLQAIEKARLQDIQNTTKAIEDQIARQETLAGAIRTAHDQLTDVKFEGEQAGRSPLEQQMASIQENARKAALEAGRAFSAGFEGMELTTAQSQELADGLDRIARSYKDVADAQTANLAQSRTFAAGWKTAFDSYMDDATNAAKKGTEMFNSMTSNMNSAIDKFVDSGKMSFGDLAKSIIKDIIKIEMKAMASKIFSGLGGGLGSLFGSLFGGGGGGFLNDLGGSELLGSLGFANGGTPPLNKASMVGERGPELFVPRSAGTIIPNDKLGGGGTSNTQVYNTYNNYQVNAVDAKSVAQLFAENRKSLLGATQMAQREQPYGR